MKALMARLNRFFFPPANATRWVRLLPYAVLGVLTLVVLSGVTVAWDYTNSSAFCGTSCHTMPPEYASYQISPHARVACVECHIGRGFVGTQLTRKAGDLKHVFYTVFQNYEYPIFANEMRPARESCEKCHFPEKFSSDSLKEIKQYQDDKLNTPSSLFLILKTGGGSQRVGLGKGIHWHIENKVMYYATDKLEQDIPYVRVINTDGSTVDYVDVDSDFDPATLKEDDLREMDCITCHNRITHNIMQPEDQIDLALSRDGIASDIPDIRKKAVEVMRAAYSSNEAAAKGIGALTEYYQVYYSDYYAANTAKILQAVQEVQTLYAQSVHIEQQSSWDTHPNNLGHKDDPGCFRCHDGNHLNPAEESIRLECNLCHSIPVVAGSQDFVANLEISRGPEPETHRSANWIAMHNQAFNESCTTCHTTDNPGGTDNSSFCSNSACHGNVWTYAGFDAPALREIILKQLPPVPTPMPPLVIGSGPIHYETVIGPMLNARCGACHTAGGMAGLDVSTYADLMQGSDNGPVVVAGDSQNSLIVQKQSGATSHFGQLNGDELQALKDWIDAGALEK